MRRRELIIGAGAFFASLRAVAQQRPLPVIGLLHLAPGDPTDHFLVAFRHEMKEGGRVEDRDLRFLIVSAEGPGDRLAAAARELVAGNPDVIVTFGDPSTRQVQRATTSIPIVAMTDDMLGSGFVTSMARPGGNTTGISIFASELDVKRLELLREIVPQAARIGVLADASTVSTRLLLESAARRLGVDLVILSYANSDEAVRAADQLPGTGVAAVNVLASPLIGAVREAIIERFNRAALPTIYQWPEYAHSGGLIGYGPSLPACYHQIAGVADKIISGTKPANLPIEQPIAFVLAINLKTAKALDVTVPRSVLARADEVIE